MGHLIESVILLPYSVVGIKNASGSPSFPQRWRIMVTNTNTCGLSRDYLVSFSFSGAIACNDTIEILYLCILLTDMNKAQQSTLSSCAVIGWNIWRNFRQAVVHCNTRRKSNGLDFTIFVTNQFRDFEEVRELKKVPYFNSRHDSPLWIDD